MRPKKRSMLIELKREIIAKHEQGMRLSDLARMYGRSTSMISAVLKRKELIKSMPQSQGITIMSKLRTSFHAEMEKQLLVWMAKEQQQGGSLTLDAICEKARTIYGDLLKQNPHNSNNENSEYSFKASRGWFVNFKKRTGIQTVVRDSETPSWEEKAPEFYIPPFTGLIESKEYNAHQAWLDVTTKNLTPAWKKLWLEADAETAFEGLEPEVIMIEEMVSPENPLGLEVDERRVGAERVVKQSQKLKTEQVHDHGSQHHVSVDRQINFKEEPDTVQV